MASLGALVRQVAQQGRQQRIPRILPVVGASLCLCTVLPSESELSTPSRSFLDVFRCHHDRHHYEMIRNLSTTRLATTSCNGLLEVETIFPDNYNESDRFFQVLQYHRTLLPDYVNRWGNAHPPPPGQQTWPRKIPLAADIPALEMDYRFCKKSAGAHERPCQDLQFRIAAYYITTFQKHNREKQMIGYRMIKDLAEKGHPDGMCYYGKRLCCWSLSVLSLFAPTISDWIKSSSLTLTLSLGIILNEGLVKGVEASPEKAVVWWRRCLDFHKHIWSTYELAVAFYTGEGVPEDTVQAVGYFRKAAHLGHAGAAYMLGELLLDGVGVRRDRASALEWIVTAAELGHYKARQRVLAILKEDWEDLELGNSHHTSEEEETLKWSGNADDDLAREILIERRYTIGGGSGNPEVLQRRKTKVSESREE